MKKISALNKIFPKGGDLLCNFMLNKGSAFTDSERENLGLVGLLPPRVNSLENLAMRVMENFRVKTSPLEKYVYLTSLQDRNKTLFYRVLLDSLEELIPIVYTPTVGQALSFFKKNPRGIACYRRICGRGRLSAGTCGKAGKTPPCMNILNHKCTSRFTGNIFDTSAQSPVVMIS